MDNPKTGRWIERRLPALVLAVAAVVVVLRVATPTVLGYDLAWQVQAAQHLLAGQGLTIYGDSLMDLALPNGLERLVNFSCGYPLLAAGLMAMGLPLAAVVKLLGAGCTLAGWLGYGFLARRCLFWRPSESAAWPLGIGALVTALPLLFTPDWDGTDIFLWASVPWLLLCLGRVGEVGEREGLWLCVLAGLLCGATLLMRYASIVLAGYAGVVMIVQIRRGLLLVVKRGLAFAVAFAPALLLQVIVLKTGPQPASDVRPGSLGERPPLTVVLARLERTWPQLSVAGYALGSLAPQRVVRVLTHPWRGRMLMTVLVIVVIGTLPIVAARQRGHRNLANAARDPCVLAAGLGLAIPTFLWVCSGLRDVSDGFDYVSVRRYYDPLIPLLPLVVCSLAAPGAAERSGLARALRAGARVYLMALAGMVLVALAAVFVPNAHGAVQRGRVFGGADPRRFGRPGLAYEASAARRFAVQRLAADPDLILLTNFEEWFYVESAVDRARVHRLKPCALMAGRKLAGPAKLLVLARDDGGPLENLVYVTWQGQGLPFPCLRSPKPLQLRAHFPDEKVKVLEVTLAAGEEIVFK